MIPLHVPADKILYFPLPRLIREEATFDFLNYNEYFLTSAMFMKWLNAQERGKRWKMWHYLNSFNRHLRKNSKIKHLEMHIHWFTFTQNIPQRGTLSNHSHSFSHLSSILSSFFIFRLWGLSKSPERNPTWTRFAKKAPGSWNISAVREQC